VIIYHWTGEYRPPDKGEWYFDPINGAFQMAGQLICGESRWILRREELPDTDGGE
jgi:hypothetical protein